MARPRAGGELASAVSTQGRSRLDWRRLEEIFHAALECEPARRPELLERACAGDDGMRAEVEALIAAGVKNDGRIESAVSGVLERLVDEKNASERVPDRARIGPYRVVGELGEGGLARVYLAERSDRQFQMRVAIKVVKRGMATRDIRRRLRQERQILASLDHPNIAHLLDGGTSDDGLPYFVMEHIEGEPIDIYCDRRTMSTRARVELFRTVCAAVHCAHQSLVIHRDLKPSNILVTAEGVPKLLDFGIAKLLDDERAPHNLARTVTGLRLLTPEYASPEQVLGRPLTTATDVYSLGVMLYRLLTGHRPYRFHNDRPGEIERVICETEPEKPSTAVGQTHEETAAGGDRLPSTPEDLSRLRDDHPERLRRRLAGDLDNIVLMAMRKEPQRRYVSVDQLSQDLERYLESRPVAARRDTLRYRAEKFVRRHRGPVLAVALALLALLGGIMAVTRQAHIARRERARAEESLAVARTQSARAEQISGFLVDLFRISDPGEARGNRVTAREILDDGAARIRHGLGGQPLDRAWLMDTMGQVYRNLGLFDRALELQRETLEIRRRKLPEGDPELARSLDRVAGILFDRGDFDPAQRLVEQALAMQRRHLGENHPGVATSLSSLAAVRFAKDDFEGAESLCRKALVIRREHFGEGSPEVAETLDDLGEMHFHERRLDSAEELFRQAYERRRQHFGEGHPEVAVSLNNIAATFDARGDYETAARLFREVLELRRGIYGEVHPDVAQSLNNLAIALQGLGRHRETVPLLREAMAINQERLGSDHPRIAANLTNLASSLQALGDFDAAGELFGRALQLKRATLGEDHLGVALVLFKLARMHDAAGRPAAAEPLLAETLRIQRAVLEAGDHRIAFPLLLSGRILHQRGDHRSAEPLLREAVEIRRRHYLADEAPRREAEELLDSCLKAVGPDATGC